MEVTQSLCLVKAHHRCQAHRLVPGGQCWWQAGERDERGGSLAQGRPAALAVTESEAVKCCKARVCL